MTLRTRLALTLSLLAATTAFVVAAAGYSVTSARLDHEIRASLVTYAERLADRGGESATRLCRPGNPGSGPERRFGRGPRSDPPPGAMYQCLAADGTVSIAATPTPLPVDDVDRKVAAGDVGLRTRSARVDGDPARIVTVAVPTGAVQVARTVAENARVLNSLVRRYLVLALLATAVAALLGGWIARRISRPIGALTTVAEEIATSGRLDLDVAAPTAGRDETSRLGRAFTTMLQRLRTARDQQAQLVQDAGHELRTPLTSIRANVAVLRRHPELDDARRSVILDDLHNELRELTDLTNELVALTGNSAEADTEPESACDLAELAKKGVERCRRRTDRSITLSQTAPAAPITGRPRQLLRAIDNLLNNAAKFSPPDTAIELTVAPRELTVRDHGPGIPANDLPHIFDRFYRATTARSLPGSGLGLAIVHDTMAAHGGSAVASNHPDGGAVVVLKFP